MKITFEKGMNVYTVLEIFEDFIKEEAEEYPLLKNNMSVNITLKNDINQINPNNEREYSFGEVDYEKIQIEKKEYADYRLQEEWDDFTSDYTCLNLSKQIETDRKYIETANEKKRKLENVEKRKLCLLKHERELANEKAKLESLRKFIDLISKNKVKYKYIEYSPGCWSKMMIFELEETYIFECDPNVPSTGELRKKDSERKFEYLLL